MVRVEINDNLLHNEPMSAPAPELTILAYDLYALMGKDDASDDLKAEFERQLSNQLWQEFSMVRLPLLLTAQQLRDIGGDEDLEASLMENQNVMDQIKQLVPNLEALFTEFVALRKTKILIEFYQKEIAVCTDVLEADSSSDPEIQIKKKRFERALERVSAADWEGILKDFAT